MIFVEWISHLIFYRICDNRHATIFNLLPTERITQTERTENDPQNWRHQNEKGGS